MLRYQLIPTFWATVKAKTVNGEVQLQALVDGKKITITKLIVRRDLQLEDAEGVDCLPNATIFEQLTLIGPSSLTTNVADKVVNEEMDDSLERAATTATGLEVEQDSGNTLRSGEDRLKLEELMALCTTLQSRVLALETTKTTQATEIASLKKRVKKLERRNKTRTHELKRLYRVGLSRRVESSKDKGLGEEDASKQGRKADIDANEAFLLIAIVYVVKTAEETRSMVEEVTTITILVKLKSVKPKATTITTTPTLTIITAVITTIAISTRPIAKGIVIHKLEQAPTPIVSSQQPSQAKIDVDYQLAQRLQAQEQDEFTYEEKARLFVQFLEQRRKHFAAKRAEEKRNRPPIRAQQRSIMLMKWVNTFVDYKTELVEESSKKEEAEIAHESSLKRA
ncbi:hypothetical protein Tco_1243601 [Tanacetum coccineum]